MQPRTSLYIGIYKYIYIYIYISITYSVGIYIITLEPLADYPNEPESAEVYYIPYNRADQPNEPGLAGFYKRNLADQTTPTIQG